MNNLTAFRTELETHLRDGILPFWQKRMTDPERGGFYGRIDGQGTIHPGAPRGAVMCARILWTFSAAYRMFGDQSYLDTATRAKDYLLDKFYDHTYGGIYWSIDADSRPLDTRKQFYALGFAIYGLSEYHRAYGDPRSLEYAMRLYRTIEEHSFDPDNNGYREAMTRDWQEINDMRLSEKDANESKTMNTHLHILEPYTNLYRIWKDDGLRSSLKNLTGVFLGRIVSHDTHHLGLFFDDRWDDRSVGAYSYGHDIEASWLLLEAAMELGDEGLMGRVRTVCREVAMASLEGYRPDGSLIYEKHADGTLDSDRHWWVQAETVVGLFYLHKFHGDRQAVDMAIKTWEYIKRNLIDPATGEWFWSIRADGSVNRDDDLAGFWKCPYHNGRMCMEILSLTR